MIWKMELGAPTKGGGGRKGMTFIWSVGRDGGGRGSGGGAATKEGEFCIVTEKENGGMVGLTVGNLVGDTTATTEVIEMAMGWRERWEQRDKMVKEKEKK